MANITRIKTNQISDGNVTAAKIASGTLVGSLFAPSVTLNSNVTILGNLSVSGNTSTINSVNTYIQDPIVVFNNGYTGSLTGYNMGVLVNRNYAALGPYGAVNTAWVWVESDQAFEAIATATSGNALTSLTSSGFANVKTGNTTVTSLTTAGTVSAGLFSGPISAASAGITTLVATNFSTGNAVISGGYITGLSNIQATNISGTTGVITNFSTANAQITGGTFSGITATSATTATATNLSSGNALITSAGITTGVVTNLSSGNILVTGGSATGLTNLASTNGGFTTLVATNFSTGNAQITSSSTTTGVVTNLSTANALVTGGAINSLTTLSATTATATNFSSANAQITNMSGTTAVFTNLSSGNITGTFNGTVAGTVATANVAIYDQVTALTTGTTFYPMFSNTATTGANTVSGVNTNLTFNATTNTLTATNYSGTGASITNIGATTLVSTNLSSGNAVITGGTFSGITATAATTATFTNLSSGNALITSAGITTLVATNFSSANAQITGGSLTGDVTVQGTTGQFTNFSTGNALVTGGTLSGLTSASATTLQATNFSSGNVQLNGADNNGTQYTSGVLQITGGAGISGNLYVSGNVYAGNLISTTTQILEVTDPLLYLAASTPGTYNYEIGIYSHFGPTGGLGYQHTGFVRDHNDYTWKLFSNVPEPTGGTVTLTNAIYDTLKLGALLAVNTASSMSTTVGQSILASGGVGIAANLAVGGNIIVGGSAGSNGQVLQATGSGLQWYTVPAGTTLVNGTSNVTIQSSGGIITVGVNNSNAAAFSSTGIQVNGTLGVTGATTLSSLSATSASITGLGATTGVVTNFSTSNAQITSSSTTTGVVTNFSTGNAQITSGSATTLVATNFSSGNISVSGGSATGLTNLSATNASATTLAATNFSTSNAQITSSSTTTGVVTNFSSGNAVITGGTLTGVTLENVTTLTATNFSSGNVLLTGGYATGLANLSATNLSGTTTVTTNFSTSNAQITNSSTTTGVVTNFSTANALVTGGAVNGLTTLGATTAVVTNFSSGNAQITGGSLTGDVTVQATTGQFTNFSSGNAVITGGYITTANITTTGPAILHGNIVAAASTATTSTTTGALVVVGGIGIAGNVIAGQSAIFNSAQGAGMDFQVKGKNDATLLWARPNATYDTVIIGNSATASTAVSGAKLVINTTDTILLPVGTNAQRPGSAGYTDVAGMFRYSTTNNTVEWYNGTSWQTASTSFTVIVDQQFNGDGGTTDFTLSQAATTAGLIVSINGVVQIPTLAYSVISSTTLRFTEAPATGDVIDVRLLTTTSTVTSLSSATGKAQITVDDVTGITLISGTGGATPTFTIPTGGGLVTQDAGVSVASANTATTIDTVVNATYRSAKYIVQVTNGSNYQTSEALVIQNGTTATVVEYGTVRTNGNLGVLSATVSGSNTLVQFIAANATNTVKVFRQYVPV